MCSCNSNGMVWPGQWFDATTGSFNFQSEGAKSRVPGWNPGEGVFLGNPEDSVGEP